MLAAIKLTTKDYLEMDLNTESGQLALTQFGDPENAEADCCGLVFGEPAVQALTGSAQAAMPTLRGNWFSSALLPGVALLSTWHPHDLLANPELKRSAWEDLQTAQKKIRPNG